MPLVLKLSAGLALAMVSAWVVVRAYQKGDEDDKEMMRMLGKAIVFMVFVGSMLFIILS